MPAQPPFSHTTMHLVSTVLLFAPFHLASAAYPNSNGLKKAEKTDLDSMNMLLESIVYQNPAVTDKLFRYCDRLSQIQRNKNRNAPPSFPTDISTQLKLKNVVLAIEQTLKNIPSSSSRKKLASRTDKPRHASSPKKTDERIATLKDPASTREMIKESDELMQVIRDALARKRFAERDLEKMEQIAKSMKRITETMTGKAFSVSNDQIAMFAKITLQSLPSKVRDQMGLVFRKIFGVVPLAADEKQELVRSLNTVISGMQASSKERDLSGKRKKMRRDEREESGDGNIRRATDNDSTEGTANSVSSKDIETSFKQHKKPSKSASKHKKPKSASKQVQQAQKPLPTQPQHTPPATPTLPLHAAPAADQQQQHLAQIAKPAQPSPPLQQPSTEPFRQTPSVPPFKKVQDESRGSGRDQPRSKKNAKSLSASAPPSQQKAAAPSPLQTRHSNYPAFKSATNTRATVEKTKADQLVTREKTKQNVSVPAAPVPAAPVSSTPSPPAPAARTLPLAQTAKDSSCADGEGVMEAVKKLQTVINDVTIVVNKLKATIKKKKMSGSVG